MKILRFSLCLLVVLLLVSCNNRRVTLDEPFTLVEDETVKVRETDLKIQLDGVGREWDDQGEYAYVSLIVKNGNGEKKISLYLDDERQIDGYVITLLSANPFDEPPVCGLRVTEP